MSREIIAIYPGTFDPITRGHLDIIQRASAVCTTLVIAVAEDNAKTPIFSIDERRDMVAQDVRNLSLNCAVKVVSFSGLLVEFARQQEASVIIRGLRAVSDYEYEFQLASMNARLAEEIQTIFLPASEATQFIASRLVKEVARLGGDVSGFVTPDVHQRLVQYFRARG